MINIVVASDIKIYCEGLAHILDGTGDFRVVGLASSCEGALALIIDKSPQVILLDMTMAGSCGLAERILQVKTNTKIVALSVICSEYNVVSCAEIGITCYVPREASTSELVEAIVGAERGECYCPPKIAACILKKVHESAISAPDKYLVSNENVGGSADQYLSLEGRLTPRENQIARLLAQGLSNKEIARDLSIEVSTVKNHVHNVLVKLEARNRRQAVYMLQRTRLQSFPEFVGIEPSLANLT